MSAALFAHFDEPETLGDARFEPTPCPRPVAPPRLDDACVKAIRAGLVSERTIARRVGVTPERCRAELASLMRDGILVRWWVPAMGAHAYGFASRAPAAPIRGRAGR